MVAELPVGLQRRLRPDGAGGLRSEAQGNRGPLRQEAATGAPALFVLQGASHWLPWVMPPPCQEAWVLCLVLSPAGDVTSGQASLKLDPSGFT